MPDMQTDIGVLKAEVKNLADAISNVGAKMDILLSMQVQLVQLQERHEHAKEQLDAANAKIDAAQALASETAIRMTKYYSFVNGVMLAGALFFSFIQWYVISQIRHVEEMDNAIQAIERRLDSLDSTTWFSSPDTNGDKQ